MKNIAELLVVSLFLLCINTNSQWVQMPNGIGTTQNVSGFVAIGTNLFAGTANGVYLSTNFGANWVAVNNGLPNTYIYDIEVNGTNVFASTPNNGVYISTNNGGNWTAINNGIPDMQVLTLATIGAYIFAGTYNVGTGVYRTTDNGLNWTNCLNTYRTYGLYANGNYLFVGTHYSGAFRSTNNGNNWTQINNGLPYVMTSAFVYNGVNLFAGTRDYGIYRSSTYGDSWSQVNNGLIHDTIGTLVSSGINVFAGAGPGGVFLSTNNGDNWSEINQGLINDQAINRLFVLNNFIFAGTTNQSAWRRHLGDFFIPVVPVLQSPLNNSIDVPVNLNLVWNSSQYAVTYQVQLARDLLFNDIVVNDSTLTDTLKAVSGLTNNTDYWWRVRAKSPAGISSYSTVYKFTTISPVGITQINSEIPKEYKLYSNYPNPFNPNTIINFQIPKNNFVTLKIYDILGREIVTRVSEQLKAGTYQVNWDGSNYSSGMYFYKLIAGDYVETKKMILIK